MPSAAATRPSRLAATFQVTTGRPSSTERVQIGIQPPSPASARTRPRRRSRRPATVPRHRVLRIHPLPRRPPAGPRRSASVRGRRPTVVRAGLEGHHHRSHQARRTRPPASAAASACAVPDPGGYPSAIRDPSASNNTAPTAGLGPLTTPEARQLQARPIFELDLRNVSHGATIRRLL